MMPDDMIAAIDRHRRAMLDLCRVVETMLDNQDRSTPRTSPREMKADINAIRDRLRHWD